MQRGDLRQHLGRRRTHRERQIDFGHGHARSVSQSRARRNPLHDDHGELVYASAMGDIPWYFFAIGGVAFVLTIAGVIAWNKFIENDEDERERREPTGDRDGERRHSASSCDTTLRRKRPTKIASSTLTM